MQINLCLTETEIRINSAQQYTDLDYTTFLCIECQLPCFRVPRLFLVFLLSCVCLCVCECVSFHFWLQIKGKVLHRGSSLMFVELKELLVQPLESSRDCNYVE